ncbi:putative P-type Cu(2+) transporter [Helianthus anomalus]
MTTDLLHISPPLHLTSTTINHRILTYNVHHKRRRNYLHLPPPPPPLRTFHHHHLPNLTLTKAVNLNSPIQTSPEQQQQSPPSVLLDVTGMMCGACVSRVKSILSSDPRVESVVVNMLTETAAVRLKDDAAVATAGELGRKLTECGFPAKRRAAGLGIEEK